MLNRDNYRRYINLAQPMVNVTPYARIDRAEVDTAWRVVCVYHLSPSENMGKHVIFVDALTAANEWAYADGLTVQWTWEGRQPGQAAPLKLFEKRPPEPRAQVDLYAGQVTSVRINDRAGIPSDVVSGLRSDVQDTGIGNTWGHNSFVVLFQRLASTITPPIDPPTQPDTLEAAWAEIRKLWAVVNSWNGGK